jgi:hypothetical protein
MEMLWVDQNRKIKKATIWFLKGAEFSLLIIIKTKVFPRLASTHPAEEGSEFFMDRFSSSI